MNRFAVISAVLFGVISAVAAETPLAPATAVVFNTKVRESVELAKFYAEQRGIARDHLVALDCSTNEEISREEYDATIRDRLVETFRQRGWWKIDTAENAQRVTASKIHFIAVMKGVPLKIRATTAGYDGDHNIQGQGPIGSRNEAAVDSEIAVLGGFNRQLSGSVPNPYFQSYRPITEIDAPELLLVSRLDAPSVGTVRRMITDSIAAERNGLWGRAYIDGAHNTAGGLEVGDRWLSDVREQLRKSGVPVVYDDDPAIFPRGYPMSGCSLYYGWYAGAVTGPFTDRDFHFVPGAVAVHIHSFSASTLRDPNANWAAPLVTKGAAATLGNVYEPFLQLTAHLDIFNDRLLHGFTFAESAAMATPALSWQTVAIGDPLYRPFASWLQLDAKRDSDKSAADWRAYHDFATKNSGRPAGELTNAAMQFALRTHNAPMLEDIGLQTRDANAAAALRCFSEARTIYATRDDILRVVLEEGATWLKQSKPKRALDLVRSVNRIASDAPAAPLLKHIEQEALGALSAASKRR